MSETRDDMTLERACEVMTAMGYRDTKWAFCRDAHDGRGMAYPESRRGMLREYEAIAVAERLERRSEDATQRLLAYAKGIMHAQDAAKARRATPAALPSRDDLGRAAYEAFTCDPERIERFGVMPSWDVLESVRQDFWCRVGEAVAAVVNPGSEVARG